MPSRVIIETIHSQYLKNNPLGDPATRQLPIYLPPGYDDSEARYPVVYLLVGFTGRGKNMLNDSGFEENIQERLDRLIDEGRIGPMIVVLPDCFTRYGGSQYINSVGTGRYEDYLVDEIIPFVDDHYRTRASRDQRAVAGKSSGGYAAVVLGMRHPQVFGAVASHSGDMYFDYPYKPDFVRFLNAVNQQGLTSQEALAEFLANFSPKADHKPSNFFDLIHISAMASCYSPNPTAPCGFDLPIDLLTGELQPEVWQRWLSHDPVELVAQHADSLRQLSLLYLDCGNRDEYGLHYGARIFARRLRQHDIPYIHHEYNGTHRRTSHRYDVSLAEFSRLFEQS